MCECRVEMGEVCVYRSGGDIILIATLEKQTLSMDIVTLSLPKTIQYDLDCGNQQQSPCKQLAIKHELKLFHTDTANRTHVPLLEFWEGSHYMDTHTDMLLGSPDKINTTFL